MTGDFVKDLNDNIDGLSDAQIADLFNWKNFFDTTYTHMGVLMGRFYDEQGLKTDYLAKAELSLDSHKQVELKKSDYRNKNCDS